MSSTSPSLSPSLSPDTKQLWETFEVTERTKHHFENNIKDRLQHVLASLRYASNLVSCHQRYDLALALVRAAETHISWLWEVEKKENLKQMMVFSSTTANASGNVDIDDEKENKNTRSDDSKQQSLKENLKEFSSSLKNVTTAAMKLRAICEVNNNNLNHNNNQIITKQFQKYTERVKNGTAEDAMLQVLFLSARDAEALLKIEEVFSHQQLKEEEESSDFDLMWLLSELQNDLKRMLVMKNDDSDDIEEEEPVMIKKMEVFEIALELYTSSNEENEMEKEQTLVINRSKYIARAVFLAQSYSTLAQLHHHFSGSTSSSNSTTTMNFLIKALMEVRNVIENISLQEATTQDVMRRNNNKNVLVLQPVLENITSSIIIRLAHHILFSSTTGQSSFSPSSKIIFSSSVEIEEYESQQIKKLQTLILFVEIVSSLCQSLEHKNHPSSSQSDALLKDLYLCWEKLSENIEGIVEGEFANTKRGQSKIRGQEFRDWLEKYRRGKILESEEKEDVDDLATKDRYLDDDDDDENRTRSSDWFDMMRERIHLLKVAREK